MSNIIKESDYNSYWVMCERFTNQNDAVFCKEVVDYFQSFYGDTEDSLKYLKIPATYEECILAVGAYTLMFSPDGFDSLDRERARDLLLYLRNLLLHDFVSTKAIPNDTVKVFWYALSAGKEHIEIGKAFNKTVAHFMEKHSPPKASA